MVCVFAVRLSPHFPHFPFLPLQKQIFPFGCHQGNGSALLQVFVCLSLQGSPSMCLRKFCSRLWISIDWVFCASEI